MVIFLKNILAFKKSTPQLNATKQLVFLKRLHRLLLDGYPLLSALQSLQWDKKMSKTVEIVISKLKNGSHLDEAFDNARFNDIIVSTLYFIRINGDLVSNIEQSIQVYEHHLLNKQKFSQVIRYPLILTAIFLILLYFIKTSILPSFIQFFHMNTDSTQSVSSFISIINMTISSFLVLCFIFVVIYTFWLLLRRKVTVQRRIFIISMTPMIKYFSTIKTSFYFANYFSTFLRAGMSFRAILNEMEQQNKLPIISYYAKQLKEHIAKGFDLEEKIDQFALLDKQLAEIFHKNNNHDSLEQDLHSFSNVLYDTFQQKLFRIMTLIQPIFFIMIGCFIIFIYATLMWPMFEFMQSM